MRGTPFREMSFCGSVGRKEVVGALLSRGELMTLVSGRRLGRNEILSLLLLFSLWGMEGDFTFGRMLGMGKRPLLFLIPPFLLWQLIKKSL